MNGCRAWRRPWHPVLVTGSSPQLPVLHASQVPLEGTVLGTHSLGDAVPGAVKVLGKHKLNMRRCDPSATSGSGLGNVKEGQGRALDP